MVFLKRLAATACLVGTLGFHSACGTTSSYVDYVETDTYISRTDPANHSESSILRLSKNASNEERTIVKLPSGRNDRSTNLSDLLANPGFLATLPFVMIIDIFADFFDCRGKTLAPALLQSAKLEIDVTSNAGGTTLAGQVGLSALGRPWWQDAGWERAHSFSETGKWLSPGGDIDTAETFAAPAHNNFSANGGTLSFEITEYLRKMMLGPSPHYGFLVRASGGSLGAVTFASAQTTTLTQRPRLVSTYNCITPPGVSSLTAQEETGQSNIRTNTYYLGEPRP